MVLLGVREGIATMRGGLSPRDSGPSTGKMTIDAPLGRFELPPTHIAQTLAT